MDKRYGGQTMVFERPVRVAACGSVVGKLEGEGPLGGLFDQVEQDAAFGAGNWEMAEGRFTEAALRLAAGKAGLSCDDLNVVMAGDLLDQSVGSTFGARSLGRPFLGIFGACSTFGEGLGLAAMAIDGGFARNAAICAGSHFCAAEKQFRYPLELGSQRPPGAGWTVTGAGAAVLDNEASGVCVTAFTIGKIVDMGIKDANNMGAAMAPAAADTILAHMADTGREPGYYDEIVTGDLGYVGRDLLCELMRKAGAEFGANHRDCGVLIFDRDRQDTKNGGSGCGCAATVFGAYYYGKLARGEMARLLLVPTGALLSATSAKLGESIPGIAHAVAVEVR